jgi:1-deoxy-D-xylulose-5-phosphate synthase
MFTEIPRTRPSTPLLDGVHIPADLRLLPADQLPQLAEELRAYLLYTVGQTGGHFGAGLGVIELTTALHYVFNTPDDRLVWDVGHQAYPHKILTGRREQMGTIRQRGGLAAFPAREESEYDTFGVGHSSTSISAALGMALASEAQNEARKVVAIIGDGALTAGMAYEALNHAGHTGSDLLVILNDNDMSISRNVGGMSNYLAKVLSSRTYNVMRESSKKILGFIPHAWEFARKTEEHMKGMMAPGTLFEEMGFNYIGPIDGHNLEMLIQTLSNMKNLKGPQFLHVVTKKGKGFKPAEDDPIGYHAIAKLEAAPNVKPVKSENKKLKYSNIFGQWLCDMAESDARLIGITPAMCEGSDLIDFAEKFPSRYFDVAIAEQHAVTLAAGFACEKMKPVVAIYSTFLQRAYDQLIHDVALQNLDVLFAIDRAGLVGEDGPTHAGAYDLTYLRCIPNMVVMTPSDENETRLMLNTGFLYNGPTAVRYPRGTGTGVTVSESLEAIEIGKGVVRKQGKQIALLAFGSMLSPALAAAESINATVVDMRFVKPLDEALIMQITRDHDLLVTLEENALMGGAGSAVSEFLSTQNIIMPLLQLGLPDKFVPHGKPNELLKECGLDKDGILSAIEARLNNEKAHRSLGI